MLLVRDFYATQARACCNAGHSADAVPSSVLTLVKIAREEYMPNKSDCESNSSASFASTFNTTLYYSDSRLKNGSMERPNKLGIIWI